MLRGSAQCDALCVCVRVNDKQITDIKFNSKFTYQTQGKSSVTPVDTQTTSPSPEFG